MKETKQSKNAEKNQKGIIERETKEKMNENEQTNERNGTEKNKNGNN